MSSAVAPAMAAPQPSSAGIRLDNWVFTPVVDPAAGTHPQVVGFLGLKDKGAATGNNLVAVWYERPASTGGTWTAKTFDTTSHWEAIKALKVGYGISDEYDIAWLTDEIQEGVSNAAPMLGFSQGFLVTDPLDAQLQGSPERDFWIDVLTSSGYKAADVHFDKGATGTCDQGGWLEEMTTEVETTLATPSTTIAGADRFESFVETCQTTTPGAGLAAVIVIGTPVFTPIVPTYTGTPNGAIPGTCKYTVCEFRWEQRIVSVINPNGTAGARQCFCEKRGNERCCESSPGAACPTLPSGACPSANNPITACGGAVAVDCPLPLTTPWKTANWQRGTSPVPCNTPPGNCP